MSRPEYLPHPAVLILLLLAFIIRAQSFQLPALIWVGSLLLALACAINAARLLTLLRRLRWIMFSLLIIYAYATPGSAVWTPAAWQSFAQFSPTIEGLTEGALQLGRIICVLAALAVFSIFLPQQKLISGLHTLGYPLRFFGFSPDRLIVRLALTLHYAEAALLEKTQDWQARLQLISAPLAPHTQNNMATIELPIIPLKIRDGLWLATGALLWVAI